MENTDYTPKVKEIKETIGPEGWMVPMEYGETKVTPEVRLAKSRKNRMVLGVCGGIADRFKWDVSLLRLGLAILTVAFPWLIAGYLIAAMILPKAPLS